MSNFNELTYLTRNAMRTAQDNLFGGKYGLDTIAKMDAGSIHQQVSWNAQTWMQHSSRFQWADWVSKELEKAAMDALEFAAGWDADKHDVTDPTDEAICQDKDFIAYLDDRAERAKRMIACEAMRKVFAGSENSSNPMTAIATACEVDAARYTLERICQLERYSLLNMENIDDLFNGRAKRQRKAEEVMRAIPRKITITKHTGGWILIATNSLGESIDVKELRGGLKKADARVAAKEWAAELTKTHGKNVEVTV